VQSLDAPSKYGISLFVAFDISLLVLDLRCFLTVLDGIAPAFRTALSRRLFLAIAVES
jgi:hypothetical protein